MQRVSLDHSVQDTRVWTSFVQDNGYQFGHAAFGASDDSTHQEHV